MSNLLKMVSSTLQDGHEEVHNDAEMFTVWKETMPPDFCHVMIPSAASKLGKGYGLSWKKYTKLSNPIQ